MEQCFTFRWNVKVVIERKREERPRLDIWAHVYIPMVMHEYMAAVYRCL